MNKPRAQTPNNTSSQAKRTSSRPVDAATLILVDSSDGQSRVLMGQRRKDLAFMPGKYVFPGGRVDKIDRTIVPCNELRATEAAKPMSDMKGTPSTTRARAIALAAIRETYEEAGLLIGERTASETDQSAPDMQPPQTSTQAASPGAASWAQFCAHGFQPGLDKLTFFARAITPPGRARRFDTRFFCADASAICHRTDLHDDELSSLQWLTLEETSCFDLPGITRVIIEDLAERIVDGVLTQADQPVPYYYFLNGSFRRDLITSDSN